MSAIVNGKDKDDFEEVQIPVPWGHIAGKWWGKRNVQPIIAIHGWQDNAGTFDNLAPLLMRKGLSIYCIDLPGHGFSSHIPTGLEYYVYWDGVHFLRRIVRYFNWKQITLIGHSLGGGISFLYAATFPDDVKKYVSLDIAGPFARSQSKMLDMMGGAIDKFLDYETKTVDQMPCYGYEDMLGLVEDAYHGTVSREGCKIMLKRGMRPAEHKDGYLFSRDVRLKVALLGHMPIEQVLQFASRIKCEVMNIRASEKMKQVDNHHHYDMVLDEIEKSAKKVERHLFEGTHHLHLNDANMIAPCIYNFLTT